VHNAARLAVIRVDRDIRFLHDPRLGATNIVPGRGHAPIITTMSRIHQIPGHPQKKILSVVLACRAPEKLFPRHRLRFDRGNDGLGYINNRLVRQQSVRLRAVVLGPDVACVVTSVEPLRRIRTFCAPSLRTELAPRPHSNAKLLGATLAFHGDSIALVDERIVARLEKTIPLRTAANFVKARGDDCPLLIVPSEKYSSCSGSVRSC